MRRDCSRIAWPRASPRCWKAPTTKSARRLSVQLGSCARCEDVQALRGILNARDGLAMLGAQLPGHINSLAGPVLESVKAQVDFAGRAKNPICFSIRSCW